MSSVSFITSTQPSPSVTTGKSTTPQIVATAQPQPAANASSSVTISRAAQAASQASTSSSGSYDFTNMTPNQMRDVAQELFNSGKIGSQQHLMLLSTGLTFGRIGGNGNYIPPTEAERASQSNTPVNYVQYSKDRISYLESAGLTSDPQYGYESWKGLLTLMQNTTSGGAA